METLQAYYDNLGCIKIKSVELVNEKGEKFDIMNENLTDAVNVSIYHDYIHTPVRMYEIKNDTNNTIARKTIRRRLKPRGANHFGRRTAR